MCRPGRLPGALAIYRTVANDADADPDLRDAASLLGALVQFGRVVTIEPGMGALAFCAVVFITIFAAEAFDPRLMWDAAQRNAHRPYALRQAAARRPLAKNKAVS